MAIVYQHRRLDTNDIFYIGMGKSEKRAYDKCNRSSIWKNIINKTDYKVEILFNYLSLQEAYDIERYLITFYGRRDLGLGNLVNLTDGGDGNFGSKTNKGKTWKHKIKRSEEHCNIISNNKIGKKRDDITKDKISKSLLGRIPYNKGIYKYDINEIINLYNQGYNNIEISKIIGCNRRTIGKYIKKIINNE